ncbi:transmembrane protein 245-like isoform X2 [Ornithodoros turicata]|uniref:transmembrane protein 245-like isoform X2 n=1 Tax=Ornithodoros turicata TaxID=34597 RepID=UPI00313906E0
MTSSTELAKSPFELFSFVPPGHEKALRHAVYNTVTILFAAFVSAATIAVYFILQPFLGPLLWAVLFGSVVHPFKRSLTVLLGGWLQGLHETSTPVAIGVVILPFQVADNIAERACIVLFKYIKFFVTLSVGVTCLYVAYNFMPVTLVMKLYVVVSGLFCLLSAVLEFFSGTVMVWTLVVGYCGALCFWWNQQTRQVLRAASPLVWTALVCHVTSAAGSWRLPLLLVVLALLAMGFLAELRCRRDLHASPECSSPAVQTLRVGWAWLTGKDPLDDIPDAARDYLSLPKRGGKKRVSFSLEPDEVFPLKGSEAPKTEEQPPFKESSAGTQPSAAQPSEGAAGSGPVTAQRLQVEPPTPERRSSLRLHDAPTPTIKVQDSEQDSTEKKEESTQEDNGEKKEEKKPHKMSNVYLSALVWSCLLAQLWRYLWLLHLTFVPLLYTIVKRLGSHFGVWGWMRSKSQTVLIRLHCWYLERREAMFPAPIHGLWRLMREGDKKMVSLLKASIDNITTISLILLVFVLAIVGTVFLAVQVYGESMHLVEVTSGIINRTVVHNPELQQLLPETMQGVQGALDSMLGDAYLYGRDWISATVRRAIDDEDAARAAVVEKQMLELWDRVYHLWVARNSTIDPSVLPHAPSWDTLLDALKTLDLGLLANFAHENLGTFMSVFDSIWALLKGNISVVLSVLTATFSLLFGGGTAVLNFVINLVVFSSALFYLLRASGERYKPLDLFSSMVPGSAGRLGEAFEEAIAGVFAASFKMAAFYGLYTWLIHTLFQVNMVYIPTALAALLGAVPFLGAYWACLPAVLELWLVQGQCFKALFMLTCQLAPISFVDTAIYSEIKGGGHPFLTGLAIAGGVFCLGVQGALFGPMLLCVLVAAMNMYRHMMQTMPVDPGVARRFSLKRTNTR